LLLEVKNLTKRYGKFLAVNNVSFNIKKGSTVLMLGPNGAGKTTIIKCIIGILKFQGGVTVDGIDGRRNGKQMRDKIGHVPQQPAFYDHLTVEKEAQFVAKLRGSSNEEIYDRLKMVNLFQFKDRKVRALSHGMKQKLSLALALLNNPPLLLFDEPITNIDVRGRLEFQMGIRDLAGQGKTILIATHLSGLSEFADNSIVVDLGVVRAEGSPSELLAKINAKDTVFVRLSKEKAAGALQTVQNLGVSNDAAIKGEWLVASVQSNLKANVIAALVNQGYNPDDIIIEPSTIESKYLSLLGSHSEDQ